MEVTSCTVEGVASGWLLSDRTDLQSCSRLCSKLSAGALGTSPKTWMVMSCMLIAKGRSRGGTDHSTIAFWGACRRKFKLHESHTGRARKVITDYNNMPAEVRGCQCPFKSCHLCSKVLSSSFKCSPQ